MRRSICYCDPSFTYAGEISTWRFVYTTAVDLPKGAKIRFDLNSYGRPNIDWELPETNLKKESNLIYMLLPSGKVVAAKTVDIADRFVPQYEFVLPAHISASETLEIVVGAPKGGDAKKLGSRSQIHSQRRRSFYLHVDPSGKGQYEDPEVFAMDVRGNTLHTIFVLAPSFVSRNKRFDVVLRFEDRYGNLTSYAPEDTLIELTHEHLRDNLKWKLFVPETGFIALPNLYFNEAGIYTIQLRNTLNGEIFYSSPIKCFNDEEHHLFWGLLHGESERFDSTENIESCLRHFRDEKALQFFAASPFEGNEETSNETWKTVSQNISDFDETDRFATFLGFQWEGNSGEEGIRQLLFLKESKQILRRKDPKYGSLSKIYKSLSNKELLSIPCFTMGSGHHFDFKHFNPEVERVVEIYNAWGSSECTAAEGNPRPIAPMRGKQGIVAHKEGSIRKALNRNCRFGFVAGGLDDRALYADLFEGDQVQYSPGFTAIIAKEHSRASLAEALYQRACYATTGPRMILGLQLAGVGMGGELNSADKPGLLINRHLQGYVAGTDDLATVEIIANGTVLTTFQPSGYAFEFTYDDMRPLDTSCIASSEKRPPFIYYYLRVIQKDGHIGWSSPIWIDLTPPDASRSRRIARPLKKATTLFDAIASEEDDEDDEEL